MMLKSIDFNLLKEAFPNLAFVSYVSELKKMMRDCKTVLDVGCGESSPMRFLRLDFSVGVDDDEAALNIAKERKTHNVFYKMDITKIAEKFNQGQFDCCVALDVIEHLAKQEGYKLLLDMERIASKKVIIFTPNGFLPQCDQRKELQKHLSGWTVEEIQKLGFSVFGMFGYQSLRGETHNLRFRPKLFWGLISLLSHYSYCRLHPKKSAAILCIKNIERQKSSI